jgi:hypothetical protein
LVIALKLILNLLYSSSQHQYNSNGIFQHLSNYCYRSSQFARSFQLDDADYTFLPKHPFSTRATRSDILEDDILHSHRHKNYKSHIELTGWALQQRCNMFLVRYGLCFYIPEEDIVHSHRRKNFKSYIELTGWTLQQRRNVFPVRYELCFYIPEEDIFHSHRCKNFKSYIELTGWAL